MNNYAPLPATITPGMKLTCPRVEPDNPEILEVLKVRDDGRLLLCRENGKVIAAHYTREELAAFDYQLAVECK